MIDERNPPEQFTKNISEHEMEILRDDGVYRHILFGRPGSSFYWFEIVTWPMHLCIAGDMGCFLFSRIVDMFDFFVGERQAPGINLQYWAQKLQAPRDVREFSEERLREHLLQWFEEQKDDLVPADREDWFGTDAQLADAKRTVEALGEAVEALLESDEATYEAGAHELLRDFHVDGVREIGDSWEWDLKEYPAQFVWCCWAIVWGINRYREEKANG